MSVMRTLTVEKGWVEEKIVGMGGVHGDKIILHGILLLRILLYSKHYSVLGLATCTLDGGKFAIFN